MESHDFIKLRLTAKMFGRVNDNKLFYCLAYKQYGFRRTCRTVQIHIVGLSLPELEMDKTVHLGFYLPLSGRSKHQFQQNISIL